MEGGARLGKVFIVSDALGGTAERIYRAAIVQFPGADVEVERVSHLRTCADVDRLLARCQRSLPSLIVYTLVESELRAYLASQALRVGVRGIDVLGPLLQELAQGLDQAPTEIPGLTHRADSNYYARVEAAEFAVRFDDGKNPKAIREADLVLVGVSRTSKTPLSLYLANRRLKVANVPVAPELPVPDLLHKEAQKVVGLTISPELLLSVRRERMRALGVSTSSLYATASRIEEELAFADRIFAQLGCPVIDVSHQAVEETADKVLSAWKRTIGPEQNGHSYHG